MCGDLMIPKIKEQVLQYEIQQYNLDYPWVTYLQWLKRVSPHNWYGKLAGRTQTRHKDGEWTRLWACALLTPHNPTDIHSENVSYNVLCFPLLLQSLGNWGSTVTIMYSNSPILRGTARLKVIITPTCSPLMSKGSDTEKSTVWKAPPEATSYALNKFWGRKVNGVAEFTHCSHPPGGAWEGRGGNVGTFVHM